MTTEVWVEWQTKWQHDPWGEKRADLRNGMLIEHIYKAAFQAVGRVVAMFAENGDNFAYEELPDFTWFMPYLSEDERNPTRAPEYGTPLDPNEMTEEQYYAMFSDVGMWKAFISGPGTQWEEPNMIHIAEMG